MRVQFEDLPKVRKCSVGLLVQALPPDESEALMTMLTSPVNLWSHAEIHRALQDEGYHSSYDQLGTHRRKQCGCWA